MPYRSLLSPRLAGAVITILVAGWAGASACVPTPFTFQETPGQDGGTPTSSSAGGAGGASSSSSADSASSSGGSGAVCPEGTQCESAPGGWDGFFLLDGASFPTSDIPPCADGSQPLLYYAFPSASDCTPCPCTADGGVCTTGSVDCFLDNICTAPAAYTVDNTTPMCVTFENVPAEQGHEGGCVVTVEPTLMEPGVCAAGISTQKVKRRWDSVVFACPIPPDTTGACAPGQTCLPASPGDEYLCVRMDGHGAQCPEGFTGDQIEVYTDGVDKRYCSKCVCEGTECAKDRFELFDGADCMSGNGQSAYIDSTQCMALPGYFDAMTASMQTLAPAAKGICSGGDPLGAVETTGPMKFCCK